MQDEADLEVPVDQDFQALLYFLPSQEYQEFQQILVVHNKSTEMCLVSQTRVHADIQHVMFSGTFSTRGPRVTFASLRACSQSTGTRVRSENINGVTTRQQKLVVAGNEK